MVWCNVVVLLVLCTHTCASFWTVVVVVLRLVVVINGVVVRCVTFGQDGRTDGRRTTVGLPLRVAVVDVLAFTCGNIHWRPLLVPARLRCRATPATGAPRACRAVLTPARLLLPLPPPPPHLPPAPPCPHHLPHTALRAAIHAMPAHAAGAAPRLPRWLQARRGHGHSVARVALAADHVLRVMPWRRLPFSGMPHSLSGALFPSISSSLRLNLAVVRT